MTLTNYKPVWIARSDGELEIKTTRYGREPNGPSDIQLDKNNSEDDYYELIPVYHEIAQEWKRILGGMLHREQRGQANEKWMLMDFPENYRLYKHIKKGSLGEPSNAAKSSSKSSQKLEDAFLYGYPVGRKKRYKSAVDFFPHLLWLAEGKSDERADCCCKMCAPEWIQEDPKPLPGREAVAPARKEVLSIKKENPPTKTTSATAYPQVVIKQRSGSQDSKPSKPVPKAAAPPPVSKPAPPPTVTAATHPPAVAMLKSTPLPSAKSYEQDLDAQVGKFLYRPGELTWFNRGNAWGLSVITKRDLFKDSGNHDRPKYLVQPLSHPYGHPDTKIILTEEDLRPWLAWSAPGPTHPGLASASFTYSSIDWKAVLDGRFGVGDPEVDGSIYAAKMIDDSFTLNDQLSNNTTTTGERSYNGLYFGGEKIWVGEVIRLRTGTGNDILILHQIIEKLKPNSTNAASATVHLIGDVYRFSTIPYTHGQEPPENPNLPFRLRHDLNYRNRVSIASKRTVSFWKILQPGSRLGLTDIKGRWYESSVLLPILHGLQTFQRDLQQGTISDVGSWINGRGDANGKAGQAGTRYKDRLETFGKAVPAGTKIGKGMDGPVEERGFPTTVPQQVLPQSTSMATAVATTAVQQISEAGAAGQGQHGSAGVNVQGVSDGDIAEFMDLDRMEDGYAQSYVEHGGQF